MISKGEILVIRINAWQKLRWAWLHLMQVMSILSVNAIAFLVLHLSVSHAEPLEAQYKISLAGFKIGQAHLSGSITENNYSLTVSARLTGLVGAITSGYGGASARGNLGNQPLSNGFSLTASNGSLTRDCANQRGSRLC